MADLRELADRILFPLRWIVTAVVFWETPCARRWCGRPQHWFGVYCLRHKKEVLNG